MHTTTSDNMRRFAWCALAIALILVLILPHQQVEAKKKEKKLLKELLKGLIFKNLSTKKNFLSLPVPIPVPIELDEPPVYLKGKPRYVTVYKPQMPVYSPPFKSAYHYPMMHPYEDQNYEYLPFMPSYGNYHHGYDKKSHPSASSSMNFNDFDDDSNQEYGGRQQQNAANKKQANKMQASGGNGAKESGSKIGKANSGGDGDEESRRRAFKRRGMIARRADMAPGGAGPEGSSSWLMSLDEQESIDHHDILSHSRVKRQAPYRHHQQHYPEQEPPCYGFPLEINIKSRIKPDQIFPLYGNSQMKKCIKFKPLLPPVEDHPDYTVLTVLKPNYPL